MAKKIKTILGSDGYEYPITSYELVLDENGESLKDKLQNINTGNNGNIDLTGYATQEYVDANEPAKVLSESEIITISAIDLQSIFNTETPVEARAIAEDYYQTVINYTLTNYKNKEITIEFMNNVKKYIPKKQDGQDIYIVSEECNDYTIYIIFGVDENDEPNPSKAIIMIYYFNEDTSLITDCVIKEKETRKLNNDFLENNVTIANSLTIGVTNLTDEEKGELSFSQGKNNIASGSYSHAEGGGTIASSEYQHVQGKFNIEDTTNTYAHIVGNGESDDARSNAHTLDWDGNAWFAGNVYIDGTPTYDNDLTTKKYVDNKVADLVDSAPKTLDTLKELATALGNDANFATTVSNQIGNKVDKVEGKGLSTNDLTNELKTNYDTAYTHSQSTHAPSNAQKNSDITKAEIEAKLIGNITTHTHSQYLTEHQSLEAYALKTDLHSHSNKATLDGISSTNISNWNSAHTHSQSAHFSGNYNDLTNKPTIPSIEGLATEEYVGTAVTEIVAMIPTTTSKLTNDSGFITSIPSEYITETELNEKGYSTFSGSYNDLTNKPTIPSKTSQLTNDSGYITSSSIPTSLPANGGNADAVNGFSIWSGTQAEYDAISSKDANTIYLIKEG